MRILRAASHRIMPWKNGGGETMEIAVSPEGATLEAFNWRVSMARIASSGPFSCFPGMDRTLCVLSGDGVRLRLAGAKPEVVTLDSGTEPFSFPADVPASADLVGRPVVDLNVMTRRGRFRHRVERTGSACEYALRCTVGETLILARTDGVEVAGPDGRERMDIDDVAIVAQPCEARFVPTRGLLDLFVVRIAPGGEQRELNKARDARSR